MATMLHARLRSGSFLGAASLKTSRFLHEGCVFKPIPKVQCPAHAFLSWNRSVRRGLCSSVFKLGLPGCKSASSLLGARPGAYLNTLKQLERKPSHSVQPRSAVSDTAQKRTTQADSSQDRLAYEVRIETSRAAGSGLSRPEGGVLVALIGTDGRFELKTLDTGSGDGQASGNFDVGGTVHSQFQGASIGALESVLLSPANGTWRPAQATVLVKQVSLEESTQLKSRSPACEGFDSQSHTLQDEEKQNIQSHGKGKEVLSKATEGKADTTTTSPVLYTFAWNEELIGEDCEESAAELVLKAVQTGEGASKGLQSPTSDPVDLVAMRATGLAEYEELKLFLLGCTAALVGVGTLGSKLALGDDVSVGFAIGGTAGLLYLLLLERTVDQIGDRGGAMHEVNVASEKDESHAPDSSEGPLDTILNRVAMIAKGPASRLVLVALLVAVGSRLLWGGELRNMEPRQILGGLVGFLAYKVAVVLAAFRPVHSSSKD